MAQRTLKIPREEAKRQLRQQIEKGHQLEGRPINTHEELQQYKRDRIRYTKYNIEMLTNMFGEDEDAFWRFNLSSPRHGADFYEELEFYKEWDGKQVNELEALEESMELIPEAKPQSHTPESEKEMSKTWREKVEEHPLAFGAIISAATATLVIAIMAWLSSARIDNITSKYEADISNMKAQYETRIRELEAKVRDLESTGQGSSPKKEK
jgi:hypothetical protein